MEDPTTLIGRSLRRGRYVLSGLLGEGAQGATFEAVDKREGRAVAIKRFVVRGARSWKDVELAEREAQVLGRLDHRLLPAALDRFEEEGALYLVMDKIEGTTLADAEELTRDDVVRFLADMAEVLDYLHGQAPPVIHRDLKPQNVIRRPVEGERRESYVLVDFGSVRQKLEAKGGSTVVGTFGYMAPEQLQGRALPATDVYAAGATALRLLTGKEPEELPHRGLAIDVAAALGRSDPAMVRVLERMLAPDPDERASRIEPLLEELRASPREPRRRVGPPPRPRSSAGASPPGASRKGRRQRRAKRHRRRFARRWSRAQEKLPAFLTPLLVLVVVLLRVLVTLGLRLALPAAMALLSLLFGRGLQERARDVVKVGEQLDENLASLQEAIAAPATEAPATGAEQAEPGDAEPSVPGPRIDVEARGPSRDRFASEAQDEALEEHEAVMEEVFDERQSELSRHRRRRG